MYVTLQSHELIHGCTDPTVEKGSTMLMPKLIWYCQLVGYVCVCDSNWMCWLPTSLWEDYETIYCIHAITPTLQYMVEIMVE